MPSGFATPAEEYEKNDGLRKEDVNKLMEWCEKQSHLPKLSEITVILFLQSCYYNNELAKQALENFFVAKTRCAEIFKNRDPAKLKTSLDLA